MGTFTSLCVAGYEIHSTRSYADPAALTVFTEEDRYDLVVRIDEAGQRHPTSSAVPEDLIPDEDDEQVIIGYSAPGWTIRDRLDVMGYTLQSARNIFESGVAARVDELRAWSDDPAYAELWREEMALLEGLSFDDWLSTFAALSARKLYSWNLSEWPGNPESAIVSPLEKYMLTDDVHVHHLGFPQTDIRYLLRAAIEACGDEVNIEQDLTDVIHAGYYELRQAIAQEARESLLYDFPANAKIVVLTEGVSDQRALEGALRLLYPHLSEYYAFMDFEGASVAGGAGPLVATVKAFAGAGIANRTIAVFDNDTAARAALRALARVRLPPTIRVLSYPSITLAENYPTLGPSGLTSVDVNGCAGSLEMYFGEDVLRRADGTLVPVQWKAFEPGVQSYQGELVDKAALQQAFARKIESAAANRELLESQDWTGMSLILKMLITAFIR